MFQASAYPTEKISLGTKDARELFTRTRRFAALLIHQAKHLPEDGVHGRQAFIDHEGLFHMLGRLIPRAATKSTREEQGNGVSDRFLVGEELAIQLGEACGGALAFHGELLQGGGEVVPPPFNLQATTPVSWEDAPPLSLSLRQLHLGPPAFPIANDQYSFGSITVSTLTVTASSPGSGLMNSPEGS